MTGHLFERSDVGFPSGGVTCRAWFYRPAGAGPHPAIVMSHGFSAVKEMGLEPFARAFAEAGFCVLVFDYRCLGESDGAERGRIVAQEQQDDLRAAVTWIGAQPGIDAERIGVWGESFSAAHALFVGATDKRIKAIVAVVPAMSLVRTLDSFANADFRDGVMKGFAADHAARLDGRTSADRAVVGQKGEACVLGGREAYEWFTTRGAGTRWLNRTSVESHARMADYVPDAFIDLIAPRPLLVQAARTDRQVPLHLIEEAFARAGEPKKLEYLDGGHFDIDEGKPCHEVAKAGALAWFRKHLGR